MDSSIRIPPTPGLPLFPVSPDRANRQYLPHSLSDLCFTKDDPFVSHSRTSSDVQGKVAQFNSLSKEAAQRRKENEAALKRAVVGREEAESETRRLKEENMALRREIEEGRSRERRVGERLEGVMEEMQRLKETHSHSQALYEKEIRRARKEAFKSSSALVKLQEDLKTTRNRLTLMREEVETQKRKVEEKEKEAFTAQYQLVGVQEELEKLKQEVHAVVEERDALKTSLKEEEVARVAAEGKIRLPEPDTPDEFTSPTKTRPAFSRRDSSKENVDPESLRWYDWNGEEEDELSAIKRDLEWHKKLLARSEKVVEFMHMECQFKTCLCRRTETEGHNYEFDGTANDEVAKIRAVWDNQTPPPDDPTTPTRASKGKAPLVPNVEQGTEDLEALIEFSPTTGTFQTIRSPVRATPLPLPRQRRSSDTPIPTPFELAIPALHPTCLSETPSILSLSNAFASASPPETVTSTPAPETESTRPPFRASQFKTPVKAPAPGRNYAPPPQFNLPETPILITRTTTTTIPLQLASPFSPHPNGTPAPKAVMVATAGSMPASLFSIGSMTREEALEQIRLRRGRARSIAAGQLTPRKAMVEGIMGRRDCSAPSVGARKNGGL
ncbi:MAG: hypothetical protein MMC33_006615 [Icmadophila ericetorum]|nr:hypothetical protein [Icmadophila ericetorum]